MTTPYKQSMTVTLEVTATGETLTEISFDPKLPTEEPAMPDNCLDTTRAAQWLIAHLAGVVLQGLRLDQTTMKLPVEWAAEAGVTILDPDGWRVDGKDFNQRVTKAEFDKRVASCTIQMGGGK